MQQGHLEVVEFLFEKGAIVDQANVEGVTPIWVASQVCFCFGFSFFKNKLTNY